MPLLNNNALLLFFVMSFEHVFILISQFEYAIVVRCLKLGDIGADSRPFIIVKGVVQNIRAKKRSNIDLLLNQLNQIILKQVSIFV